MVSMRLLRGRGGVYLVVRIDYVLEHAMSFTVWKQSVILQHDVDLCQVPGCRFVGCDGTLHCCGGSFLTLRILPTVLE